MVRILPNRTPCVRLIGAHCMEANEQWHGRRYLSTEPDRIKKKLPEWLIPDSGSACEFASVPSTRSLADALEM